MAEQGNGLLLSVICLADLRPLWPGVVFCPLIRGFGHHLNLGHGFTAVADAGAHAVVSGVAAADDDHVFIPDIHEFPVLKIRIQQAFGVCLKEIHRKINSLCVSPRHVYISGIGGSAG